MGDFYQNGIITTLHILGHRPVSEMHQDYFDLIENKTICRKQGFTKLDPYQTLWISNTQN